MLDACIPGIAVSLSSVVERFVSQLIHFDQSNRQPTCERAEFGVDGFHETRHQVVRSHNSTTHCAGDESSVSNTGRMQTGRLRQVSSHF